MKKQNFTTFIKNNSNEKIKAIVEEYAIAESTFARTYFTDRYNITQSCFYKLIEIAIVNDLISEKYCKLIGAKSSINQRKHGAGQTSSVKHHQELMRKRTIKKVNAYPNEQLIKIATDYANNIRSTSKSLSKKYNLSILEFNFILNKVITECLVSDECYQKIKAHSLSITNNFKNAHKYFCQVEIKRDLIKLPIFIDEIETKIKNLENSSLDLTLEENSKTLENLNETLEIAKHNLEQKQYENSKILEAKEKKLKSEKEIKKTRKSINGTK